MFKKLFFLGLTSIIISIGVAMAYTSFYFDILADFSEVVTFILLLAYYSVFCMLAVFLFIGLHRVIKRLRLVMFLVNTVLAIFSVLAVFYVLKSNDPVFKNEDTQIMIDYFKGFLMPLLFIPSLVWMALQPLFISEK